MIKNSIRYLKIFTSFRCNLNCLHCVHSSIAEKEYNKFEHESEYYARLKDFLIETVDLNPGLKVYLSGGEPLLSDRFFITGKLLKNIGLEYKTITNGILLARRIDVLLEAPPSSIWITFNGTGSDHDTIVRKKRAFENLTKRLKDNINILKTSGIKVGAIFMINHLTYKTLSKDLEFFRIFEFDEVVIQHLSYLSGRIVSTYKADYYNHFGKDPNFCFGENADSFGIDAEILYNEIQNALHKSFPFKLILFPDLRDLNRLRDYYSENPILWRSSSCKRALYEWWVLPDGTICACYAHKIGDISDDFKEVANSAEWKGWKDNFNRLTTPLDGCLRCHRLYM